MLGSTVKLNSTEDGLENDPILGCLISAASHPLYFRFSALREFQTSDVAAPLGVELTISIRHHPNQ